MSEEIKQISEEQARRMHYQSVIVCGNCEHENNQYSLTSGCERCIDLIEALKPEGFIEKSELEIAAERYENTFNPNQITPTITNYIDLLKSELEKKNKEIQELRK